jgi:8-oxo-dGTP diphosphatase
VHAYAATTVALATYRCALVAGTPTPSEHAELRWVAPADLTALDWAPADLPAVVLLAG